MRLLVFFTVLSLGASLQAGIFLGNGNSGFGGVLGPGQLELTNSGDTVNATLTTGGSFNDALVIYIDSQAGGFSDIDLFGDTADSLRAAISGFDGTNKSQLNFAAGFEADYAIALSPDGGINFGGQWELAAGLNNSLIFQNSVNLSPTGGGTAGSSPFTFDFALSSLGIAAGDSFDFVATYLNPTNAFRSDEAIGDGIGPGNPGTATSTFTNFQTFNSTAAAVPEPGHGILLALATGFCFWQRRSKRAVI